MSVTLQTSPDRITFQSRGERFAAYDYRGLPGFTDLLVPEGRPLTRPDPVSRLSLWIGHEDINGIAFGMAEEAPHTSAAGQIVTREMTARRGSQSVGFQQECSWVAPGGQTLLEETRTVRVTSGPSEGGLLDMTLSLRAPADTPVQIGSSDLPLLRLQVAAPLFPPGGGQIRSSANGYDIESIHGHSASWCACTGVVQGETVGLVVFAHSGNLWHPAPWAVLPGGLMGPAPFLGRLFQVAPQETLLLRYRVQTYRGYVEAGWIRQRLAEFSHSPLRI